MKAKSTKREWSATWMQTVLSIIALIFAVLVGFGVMTPEQSTEAQPLIASVIAGVVALIGIFFKQEEPVK
jgi:fumarate reductase subunit D